MSGIAHNLLGFWTSARNTALAKAAVAKPRIQKWMMCFQKTMPSSTRSDWHLGTRRRCCIADAVRAFNRRV